MLPDSAVVRQVVLAVMGSGRTAMLFVSGAERRAKTWTSAAKARLGFATGSPEQAHRERVLLIQHACEAMGRPGSHHPRGANLAQSLLEGREREAAAALRDAGFMTLGELVYMRRPLPKGGLGPMAEEWGRGPLGLRASTSGRWRSYRATGPPASRPTAGCLKLWNRATSARSIAPSSAGCEASKMSSTRINVSAFSIPHLVAGV